MLEIKDGYLCLYGKKYSELNNVEKYIFSEEILEQKKTTQRSGKTIV